MNKKKLPLKKIFMQKKGVSLLEVTVAIGLFSVLMLLTVGIMLNALNIQKKMGNIQSVIDNTRFSMELMTREMRTGTNFSKVNLFCPNESEKGLQFTDINQSPAERRFYYLDGVKQAIMRVAMPSDIAADCTQAKQFTAEEVIVDNIHFVLNGETSGPDDGQPWATIFLKIRSKSPKVQLETIMQLQTTVVPRMRDL